MEARKTLADNIQRLILKRIREKEFQSILNFASATGIQKSLLSRILNHKADPKLSSLVKIAAGLEVPVADLLKSKK